MRNHQNDLINELNQRNKPTISPQDIQDGQFENIILGMKSEPYRTPHNVNGDIHRRSYRRQRSSNSQKLTDESGPLWTNIGEIKMNTSESQSEFIQKDFIH